MKAISLFLSTILLALPLHGQEGAFPLYLLGYMSTKAGYMPPPGLYVRNDVYHHNGHVKGGLFGGRAVAKVNAKLSFDVLTLSYVTPWKLLGANVAFGGVVPAGRVNVHAKLDAEIPRLVRNSGSCDFALPSVALTSRTKKKHQVAHGIGDSLIIPLMLGWHADSLNLHLIAYQGLFVPTGSYKKGHVANMGQNHFATETDAGFTWLNTKTGTELSAMTGITSNFTNHKIKYRSGTAWHTEFFAGQYLMEDLEIGVAGYYFYQLTPDKFRGKQFFNGFRGKVFGIAPLLSYNFKIADIPVFANVRYYTESDSKNYLKGNSFFFTLTVALP